MPQFTNDRDGRTINLDMSRQDILASFGETAEEGNWLWYWLAKHVADRRDACPKVKDMILFLADSFLFTLGMGLKRPMIRLHHKDRRYKIYLSERGTICFKTGGLIAGTNKPNGNEQYMGCLTHGKFLSNRDRRLLPGDDEVIAGLSADPAGFLAQASKDMDRCAYCYHGLDDPRSKQAGYGPDCAVNWGLPWGKSYDDKVPSFAQMWARSGMEGQRNVRGMCEAIRGDIYNETLWAILGDVLEENGYTKKPGVPELGVRIPRAA